MKLRTQAASPTRFCQAARAVATVGLIESVCFSPPPHKPLRPHPLRQCNPQTIALCHSCCGCDGLKKRTELASLPHGLLGRVMIVRFSAKSAKNYNLSSWGSDEHFQAARAQQAEWLV